VEVLESGLADLTLTAAGLGTAVALDAEVLVECNIFLTLHCVYGAKKSAASPLKAHYNGGAAGHGMFKANGVVVPNISGAFCPDETTWTALFEPLERVYLSS
jgi:hypothetical protein